MKKTLLLLVIIFGIALFAACSSPNETSITNTSEETSMSTSYLEERINPTAELGKSPLPTYSDIQKIKVGMLYQEVYDVIKNPQSVTFYSGFNGATAFYLTIEGDEFAFALYATDFSNPWSDLKVHSISNSRDTEGYQRQIAN